MMRSSIVATTLCCTAGVVIFFTMMMCTWPSVDLETVVVTLQPKAAIETVDHDVALRWLCAPSQIVAIARDFLANRIESRCPNENLWLPLLYASSGSRISQNLVFFNVGANKGFALLGMLKTFAPEYCVRRKISIATWMNGHGDCGACDACVDAPTRHWRLDSPQTGSSPPAFFGYEPGASTFDILNKTVQRLGLEKVMRVFPFAFGNVSEPSVVKFPVCAPMDESCGINTPYVHTGKFMDVPLTSVDLEAKRLKIAHIHVLQIDTEGHDPDVIFGASQMLSRGAISILEYEHHGIGKWLSIKHKQVVDFLDSHGFDCYWAGQKKLWRITGCWSELYELRKWSNVICVSRAHPWRSIIDALSFRAA